MLKAICRLFFCFVCITSVSVSKAQDSLHLLQDVVVTGQYSPQSLKNSVYRIRTINSQRIAMRGYTDISGVLNNELGIRFATDYTLGETDISMMGLSGQNVKILLDGIPLADRSTTKQSLGQIDINSIEKIEIVEGPMSTIYGTDALAGVINIITKKNRETDNLKINLKMQEESVGKTYRLLGREGIHNENTGINWKDKQWRLSGYLTRNNFGGYTDTAAYPAKVSKPKKQWMSGGVWDFQNQTINIWYRLDYLHENIWSAGVMNVNTGKAVDQYFITNRYTHQVQADWQLKTYLKINNAFSYQDYTRNTETYNVDYVLGSKIPSTGSGEWDVTNFKTWFFRSTVQWLISPGLSLQPGIEFRNDKTDGERVEGHPSIQDYSLFVSAEIKPLKNINIRPGIRFSKNSVYDAPPVIPSLNTKFVLNRNLDLRLSYARGFRAPVLRELYFYFHDSNHDIDGNPNLKAETSNSFTGSLTWQRDSSSELISTLSGFYNDIHNSIGLAQVNNTSLYTYTNISRTKSIGGSLNSTLSKKNISIATGISFIGYYNKYTNDSTVTGNHSQFTWTPEVNANITYTIPKAKLLIGLFYKFSGALPSYQANNGLVYISKIGSYNWADVTVSRRFLHYLTFQTGIKNIFNIIRLQNTALDAGSVHTSNGPVLTGYGRSFFAAINFQWSKH